MIWNPFKITPKGFLGIDIGTSTIKIVEMSRAGKRRKLDNYGEMKAEALYEKPFRTFEKSTLSFSDRDVVRALSAVMKEAVFKTNKAFFSIPDFTTFFTTSVGNGTLREAGLFGTGVGQTASATSGTGQIFCRTNINRTKTSNDTLTLEWTITIS